MSIAIKVENLSKAYQLGQFSTGTLSRDIERWWALFRGKDDPFLKIGETNDRSIKGNSDVVWSLKNIDFEIPAGEAFGIVGRNGAGKSTLLKVLSQVTNPTRGLIKVKGRIASLLEVGTGFHPELTGKENIFLNGAILGMTKREIKSKYDEIVDFSGVERYINTPVKRYSSGMYVRLAFAVAAHLEPEILIVDEVLAVGDAEFQQKCMGKMKDVSGQGRTVLFVSHNMTAIKSLCNRTLYLKNGIIERIGSTPDIVNEYLNTAIDRAVKRKWDAANAPGDDGIKLKGARLVDNKGNDAENIDLSTGGGVEFEFIVQKEGLKPVPNLHLFDQSGEYVFVSSEKTPDEIFKRGLYKAVMWIPSNLLNDGKYVVGLAVTTYPGQRVHFFEREAIVFEVHEDVSKRESSYRGDLPGPVRPKLKWDTIKVD